jgi:hypothetical protein
MSNRASRQSVKNRRPQTPKGRNLPMAKGMLELRQGSRTTPVPSGKQYTRNTKHKGQGYV